MQNQLSNEKQSTSKQEELREVRRAANLVGAPLADKLTLKTVFRASPASAAIAAGETPKAVMDKGEWKSSAILNYLDESIIDLGRLLQTSAEQSDEEG